MRKNSLVKRCAVYALAGSIMLSTVAVPYGAEVTVTAAEEDDSESNDTNSIKVVLETAYTDEQGVGYAVIEGLHGDLVRAFVNSYEADIQEDITIPERITVDGQSVPVQLIRTGAFRNCERLKSVNTASVPIAGGAFAGCKNLESLKVDASQYYVDEALNIYSADKTTLVHISPVIEEFDILESVIEIGESAGAYNRLCSEIVLPEGIVYINDYAFAESAVKTCVIPDSCELVESYVFWKCAELTKVSLSKQLESIGLEFFKDCTKLEEVELPLSIGSIGIYSFDGCSSLKNVIIEDASEYYYFENGCLYNKDKTILHYVLVSVESAELLETVTTMEIGAFANNTKLKSVKLSSNLTNIAAEAFKNCTALEELYLPDGITEIGANAFSGCTSLEKVRIPSTLTLLEDAAFENCTKLAGVKLPAGLIEIGGYLFAGCGSLKKVVIPASVVTIHGIGYDEENPDEELTWEELESLFVNGASDVTVYGEAGSVAEAYAKEKGIVFSTDVENAGVVEAVEKSFEPSAGEDDNAKDDEGNTDVSDDTSDSEDVNTPAAVGTILTDAVNTCEVKVLVSDATQPQVVYVKSTTKSAKVSVPDAVLVDGVTYTITQVADNAFLGNKKLTELSIGKNVTTIGKNAFKNCKKLKKITISGTSLKKIGAKAFKGVVKTAVVKVPKAKKGTYKKLLKKAGFKGKIK